MSRGEGERAAPGVPDAVRGGGRPGQDERTATSALITSQARRARPRSLRPPEAARRCQGETTMATIRGDDGDNRDLFGLFDDDEIFGYGGNDVLDGFVGNDRLHGGTGRDALFGGDDSDVLYGDDGDDRLDGGSGAD